MKIIKILLAIILPPVAAFLQVGTGIHFWLNIVLCFLGGFPGTIHAVWLVLADQPKTKKPSLVIWVILAIPFLLFSVEIFFMGGGIKRLYYLQTYDKDKVRVAEGSDFIFHKEGFSESYKLNSKYYVPHRILLIPESKSVPVDYEFGGEMLIEIYDTDKLLHSYKTNEPTNLFRQRKDDNYITYLTYSWYNTSRAYSTFAFELGEIPFELIRLRWGRLKNMKIKITVVKPDENLMEYCNKATLVIIPDLRL